MRFARKRVLATICVVGAVFVIALALPAVAQELAKEKMCQVCHGKDQGASVAVTDNWTQTKHATATGDGPRYNANGEPGVGCQACHGAGQAHVKAAPEEKVGSIGNPAKLETREQKLSLCGRCHGQYAEGFVEDYAFGDNILDKITLAEPTGGKHEQLNEMKDSTHFTAPTGPTCIDCHTGHMGLVEGQAPQLKAPIMELCLGCHATQEDLAHSKYPEIPEGATCATCHMPEKKHIFKVPAPQ